MAEGFVPARGDDDYTSDGDDDYTGDDDTDVKKIRPLQSNINYNRVKMAITNLHRNSVLNAVPASSL